MKPSKQLIRHDPRAGQFGDCFRTCIAAILELDPADVPHLNRETTGLEQIQHMQAFLARRGLGLASFAFERDGGPRHVLELMGKMNPGVHYLLAGQSATGCGHYVVCKDDKIVLDPSLTDSGILGPQLHDDGNAYYWVTLVVKP